MQKTTSAMFAPPSVGSFDPITPSVRMVSGCPFDDM